MKNPIEINAQYSVSSMPMVKNYEDDDGSVFSLAKYHEHGVREIVYGDRIVMPLHEFESQYIVQTWLVDPNGDSMTTRRKRLMTTKYLKQLLRGATLWSKQGSKA